MELPYDHNDIVLKEYTIHGTIDATLHFFGATAGIRNKLEKALKQARKEKKTVKAGEVPAEAFYDEETGEYLIILKNSYDPRNLVAVLFDRIVEERDLELKEDLESGNKLIDNYLGRIEEKEKVDLAEYRKMIKSLAAEMKETIHLTNEHEFSEQELEHLSGEIDERYYGPIVEQMEEILATISD